MRGLVADAVIARDHHIVIEALKALSILTKTFAHLAFHPIAKNTSLIGLHRNPKTCVSKRVWDTKDQTRIEASHFALIKKSKILGSPSYSNKFRESHYFNYYLALIRLGELFRSYSWSQALTAASATTFQNFLSVLGRHACTEPVSLRSLLS